ncbi:MAG: hypothetical protein IJ246_08210 [Clostridia bacterium]|nr:hypothetical protein [Clostridia bacterium]
MRCWMKAGLLLALCLFLGLSAQAEEGSAAVKMQDVYAEGMLVGHTALPGNYSVTAQLENGTLETSVAHPLRLTMTAFSADRTVMVGYQSLSDYEYIVKAATWADPILGKVRKHADGGYDTSMMCPMLTYLNAAGYCDYIITHVPLDVTWNVVGGPDLSSYQQAIETNLAAYFDTLRPMAGLGYQVEGAEMTVAERFYRTEVNGVPQIGAVCTMTVGAQLKIDMMGISETDILWSAPCTYIMIAPESQFLEVYPAFTLFMANTTVSDQFNKANERASAQIREAALAAMDLSRFSSAVSSVLRAETSRGDDYNDDRFTDYILDQDDYTLSDGTSVKVPSEFTHVYEGDNGTVYASTSAFGQPGGSRELTPNR